MQAIYLSRFPDNKQVKIQYERGLNVIALFRDAEGRYVNYLDKNWRFLPKDALIKPALPKEAHVQDKYSSPESIDLIYLIYMAAEVYALLKDERALKLAEDGFVALDRYGWDSEFGGYFNTTIPEERTDFRKDTGQHMHAGIALTKLYQLSPKAEYRERAIYTYNIICEKTINEYGLAYNYMNRDWSVADFSNVKEKFQILAGHDAEVIWYLEDIANCFNLPYSPELLRLKDAIFSLVTDSGYFHAGCSVEGKTFPPRGVIWWSQLEIVIALLRQAIMQNNPEYVKEFWKIAKFNIEVLVNPELLLFHAHRGYETGEYGAIGGAGWKGGLHVVRSMQECIKVLEKMDKEGFKL